MSARSGGDDVLFDVLGPRGRRRTHIATAVVALLVAVLVCLAVRQFAAHGQLAAAKWQPFTTWPIQRFLLTGLLRTLQATAVSALLAFPIGALVALARLARHKVVSWPAAVYTELFRALPVLLLIYVFLLVLPRFGLTLPLFWQLVVPIVISASASTAEVFRAGVLALERGQSEAAFSIGLTYWQTMRIVVLPQVVRRLLPALVTALVSILKDTTLGYVVSYPELLKQGQTLGEYTATLVQTFLVVAVVFVLANGALSQLAGFVERRQGRVRAGGAESRAPEPERGELPVRLDA
ncbi:MAG: amino acid ABC transporter permease [Motilibacteraceae bacterium]